MECKHGTSEPCDLCAEEDAEHDREMAIQARIDAAVAAERGRWAKRVREAFNEGFSSPETYNDTLQNSADEAWEKEKAWLLRA